MPSTDEWSIIKLMKPFTSKQKPDRDNLPGSLLKSLTAVVATLLALTFSSQLLALYKWVDENGQIHYSEQLPLDRSKQRFQTLDKAGRILDTQEAKKTPEQKRQERAEQERLQREEEARQREEERIRREKAFNDNVLLMTFSTEQEIVEAQKERIDVIDSVIGLLLKDIEAEENKLTELQDRARAVYSDKGKEVPGGLAQNIEYSEEKIANHKEHLQLKLDERDKIEQQYIDDLERFRVLTKPAEE